MKCVHVAVWTTAFALSLARAQGAEEWPAFTKNPAATKDGGRVKIEFAVNRETDVAVYVEDAGGKIVRHLVAGVLGKNVPAPLAPGLAQSVEWDGKADYGENAGSGPFKVRVALGLTPRFDKVLLSDPYTLGGINCLAVGPDGTLSVMMGCGGTGPVWTGQQMVAFNRDGTYKRMLMPFPADLKMEEAKGFDVVELNGRPAPLVHEMQARSFYGGRTSRKAGMAATPGGQVLTLLSGGRIGALDARGASPWGEYVGPRLLPGLQRGQFNQRPFIAASSDGKGAYVTGLMNVVPDKKPPAVTYAAVYRVPLPQRGPATPFFGIPDTPGKDETHLAAGPHGLAVDGKGDFFIADYQNDRVVVVSEADGRFVGAFDVEKPDGLGVDPATGAVYVTRLLGKGSIELVKFDGWKTGKPVAKLPVPSHGNGEFPWVMAVDAGAKPPVIWLGSDGAQLLRIEDLGDKFGAPQRINKPTIGNASFVDISVDRGRSELYTRCGTLPSWWYRYREATGEWAKVQPGPEGVDTSSQLVSAPDGTLYATRYAAWLSRFDRNGKPLAWANPRRDPTGKDKPLPHTLYVPVSMTFLGHTLGIRHDGHIFMLEPGHTTGRPPKMLHEYLPTGERVTKDPIIWKVSDTAVGPKFDAQGNIYIADQVRPVDQLYPPEFAALIGPVKLKESYIEGLKGSVASMYGSIVKFTPKGGMIHFGGENPFEGEARLDPSLKTVDAASFGGARLQPTKITGAQWVRMGVSHVDLIACNCENTRFDVDEFGRVFYPDLGRFRVGVLDTNGNDITHFGQYGNADTTDDLAFTWLIGVGVTDRYAYMGDSLNRRLLRAKLVYAAEETCLLP